MTEVEEAQEMDVIEPHLAAATVAAPEVTPETKHKATPSAPDATPDLRLHLSLIRVRPMPGKPPMFPQKSEADAKQEEYQQKCF